MTRNPTATMTSRDVRAGDVVLRWGRRCRVLIVRGEECDLRYMGLGGIVTHVPVANLVKVSR